MRMLCPRFLEYPLRKLGTLALLGIILTVPSTHATAAPVIQRITIGTFAPHYSPNFVQVRIGTSIAWKNSTSSIHSITHDACLTSAPCMFDSGAIGPNQTFTINHLQPGSYPYHCTFHPIMRGVLVVLAPDYSRES